MSPQRVPITKPSDRRETHTGIDGFAVFDGGNEMRQAALWAIIMDVFVRFAHVACRLRWNVRQY